MRRMAGIDSRSDCLSPTDPRLLGNPLDFIAEDHLRERQICALMDVIAQSGDLNIEDVENVLSFLGEELRTHLEDEEQDLFPMMRARCEEEDEIDAVIDRLQADHANADRQTELVSAALARLIAAGAPPDAEERALLADFAGHSRRHLILENAIILPIARARLTDEDLDRLRQGMLRRRGLDRIVEATDVG